MLNVFFNYVTVITLRRTQTCRQMKAWCKNQAHFDAHFAVIVSSDMTKITINTSLSVFSPLCHNPLFFPPFFLPPPSVSGLGPRQAADGKAPHGPHAHLVCLLSFLPVVKLNVLLWVLILFLLLWGFKRATVELPHVNGAKKADRFSFSVFFYFPELTKRKKEMQTRLGT